MSGPRIVYTRHDGGVSVCQPAAECIAWLGNGGYWAGRGGEWLEQQVARRVSHGCLEWAVRRFIRAMDEGGCTTAQAFEIIRDRDCGHLGTGHELWSAADLPDRWFRNAWRRSHNGGPISIDMDKAREIQFSRIRHAVKAENDLRREQLRRFSKPVRVSFGRLADRIHKADSPRELRRIWPQELAA